MQAIKCLTSLFIRDMKIKSTMILLQTHENVGK